MSFWEKVGGLGGIGSALGSIGSVLSAFTETNRRKKLMDYQNKINNENYDKQLADQIAMYEKQLSDQRSLRDEDREYNDYASVVQRAKKAGLNPFAILGQTTGVGISSSATTPSSNIPSIASSSIPSADNMSQSLNGAVSTILSTQKQNKLLDAQLESIRLDNENKRIENDWKDKNYAQNYENNEVYRNFLEAGILDKKASARLSTARADGEEILNDIRSNERTVSDATIMDKISIYNTNAKLAIDQLIRSNIDTQYHRDIVIGELDKLNAETDAIAESLRIDWANVDIAQQNATTASRQYSLNRQEAVWLDQYRDDLIELERKDQHLREKIEENRNRKDYIKMFGDWIMQRNAIQEQKERSTQEFKSKMSSAAGQMVLSAIKFAVIK